MGTFVEFWHGAEDGLLGHFLAGPLDAFQAWCVNTESEFPGDIQPTVLPLLDVVFSRGALALCATTKAEALACDELLDTYYGMFCDYVRHDLLEPANDSILYVSRYHSIRVALEVEPSHSAELRLWSYLLNGRPVLRDPTALPYISLDNAFWLSFWSAAEVALMLRTIASPFPTWLLAADPDALRNTEMALASAAARGSGLIISVG